VMASVFDLVFLPSNSRIEPAASRIIRRARQQLQSRHRDQLDRRSRKRSPMGDGARWRPRLGDGGVTGLSRGSEVPRSSGLWPRVESESPSVPARSWRMASDSQEVQATSGHRGLASLVGGLDRLLRGCLRPTGCRGLAQVEVVDEELQ
jgi:hypothetical protein